MVILLVELEELTQTVQHTGFGVELYSDAVTLTAKRSMITVEGAYMFAKNGGSSWDS